MRHKQFRLGAILVTLLALFGSLSLTSPVVAATGPIYSVMNTDEYPPDGVYFRNSPSWDDTDSVSGLGVYRDEQVQLKCWSRGSNVPRRDGGSNLVWYQAENTSRPTTADDRTNAGWLNAHFVDDGMAPGEVAPDVPPCSGGDSSGELPGGGSLYFSPYPGDKIKVYSHFMGHTLFSHEVPEESPATVTLHSGQWESCNLPEKATPSADQMPTDQRITTLSAWSLSRAEPFVYLDTHTDEWDTVNYVLLIDPGNTHDYYTEPCDESSVLVHWLDASKDNVLMVLAGEYTADRAHPVNGYAHAGIQNKLFNAVRNYHGSHNLRSQVVVCNYDTTNHEDMWLRYKGKMNDSDHTSCPGTPDSVWHP